jgi:hypothetical protein
MSSEDRDDLDRALAAGLRGLVPDAGDTDDADGALAAMRPRLRRARNQRRMVRASAMVGGFVAMGSAAFALAGPSTHHASVSVASLPSTTRGAVTATTSTTRTPATTVAPSKPSSTTVTLPERPTGRPAVAGGGGPSPAPSLPSGATTTTVAPSELHTYHSVGGTVTVRFSGGRLTLVSYGAAPGYAAEVHSNDPDDVEVRFSGPEDRRIRIRVEEGHLTAEIR